MADNQQRYVVHLTCGHEVVRDLTPGGEHEADGARMDCPECSRPQPVREYFAIEP